MIPEFPTVDDTQCDHCPWPKLSLDPSNTPRPLPTHLYGRCFLPDAKLLVTRNMPPYGHIRPFVLMSTERYTLKQGRLPDSWRVVYGAAPQAQNGFGNANSQKRIDAGCNRSRRLHEGNSSRNCEDAPMGTLIAAGPAGANETNGLNLPHNGIGSNAYLLTIPRRILRGHIALALTIAHLHTSDWTLAIPQAAFERPSSCD